MLKIKCLKSDKFEPIKYGLKVYYITYIKKKVKCQIFIKDYQMIY